MQCSGGHHRTQVSVPLSKVEMDDVARRHAMFGVEAGDLVDALIGVELAESCSGPNARRLVGRAPLSRTRLWRVEGRFGSPRR